ncbi:MAG: multidrug transporter [Alphaproteobacteria bacterium]|nr:multidrug transporter [Alphaproteobacteria bacterium]
MSTIRKQQRYRRADNGEYTSKRFAEKNPSTTVKETDKQAVRHKRKKR